jgi:hypothetical protein
VKWLAIAAGLAAASWIASGQDALPDWVLRLSRVKHHLKDNFERIPNYVCRESVERYQIAPHQVRTVKVDSLEFDVAEVDQKELLARPGAGGFEDRELSSYVSTGILGTGSFASLPLLLFVADRARVTPHPRSARNREGWDYDIPAFLHGYEIASEGGRATVGVRGTFWVNGQNMDLIRIDEGIVDPPLQMGLSASSTSVEYARMRIGISNVLLPQSARLTVVTLDGTELRNEIRFSDCREYRAESTVTFGNPKQ